MIGIGRQALSLAQPVAATVGRPVAFTSEGAIYSGSGKFSSALAGGILRSASVPDLHFGSADWIIEAWFKFDNVTSIQTPQIRLVDQNDNGYSLLEMYVERDTRFTPNFLLQFGVRDSTETWKYANPRVSISQSIWYHVAFARAGTQLRTYFNGSLSTGATITGSVYDITNPILRLEAASNGHIDDVRIQLGTSTYGGVPESAQTNTANTVVLLHLDNNAQDDNS